MTETSGRWNGSVTGDAQAYCKQDVALYQRSLISMYDRTTQGVIYTLEAAYNGQLECTNPAGVQIQVDTGTAVVNGYVYWNDAAITLNPASGDGFYRVVLQNDYVAQTIRAVLIYNAVATPALTQVDGGVWEIALANFEIAAGAITVAGVVDEREFINAETKYHFVLAHHGYDATGVANIYPTLVLNFVQPTLVLPAASSSFAYGYTAIDNDFIDNMTIEAVVADDLGGASGTVQVVNTWDSGGCGQQYNNTSQNTGALTPTIGSVGSRTAYVCIASLSVTAGNVNPGDVVRLSLNRQNAGTYAGTLKVVGWNVSYFGYKR